MNKMNLKQFLTHRFFWYADISKIDLKNRNDRRWVLEKILVHGLISDIKQLDYRVIKNELRHLILPKTVENLWKDYFRQ